MRRSHRSGNRRAVLSGQRQRALVVRFVLHTRRDPSEFRAFNALRAELHGPDRPDGVHRARRVDRPRGPQFHQGVHRAYVELGRRRAENIHAKADKLSAEERPRREVGTRRQNCVARGGQLSKRHRPLSRPPLPVEHQTRTVPR